MNYRLIRYASSFPGRQGAISVSHPFIETRDGDSDAPRNNESNGHSEEKTSGRIAISSRRKIVFVDLADVVAVEARCNYVVLQTPSGPHTLRHSISAIAENFEQYGFIRIHRSTIVNGAFVEEIRTSASGKMFVNVKGLGSGYLVSRTYRGALRSFASRWTYGAKVIA